MPNVKGQWLTPHQLRSGIREQAWIMRSGHHHGVELTAVRVGEQWRYRVAVYTDAALRWSRNFGTVNEARQCFASKSKTLGEYTRPRLIPGRKTA